MKLIKLGIIGCGIAAQSLHWPVLQELKDKFEITAICNHTEKNSKLQLFVIILKKKPKIFLKCWGGVPYVLDYHDLLQRADVEAVDIVLPIQLNYQVTKDALDAGKHVIVEKPLAANLSEARMMLDFEDKYSLVMMVAENYRYRSIFHRVKNYLQQGKIGNPYAVFWNRFIFIDLKNNKYAQTKWRINHQYKGGFVTDAGIHYIAALRDMFGEINYGIAFTRRVNPNIGEIDSMSFQFRTDKNIYGVLNAFYSSKGYEQDCILISGSEGSILVENNKLTLNNEKEIELEEAVEESKGYKEEFEDFYRGIRLGKKVRSSFYEGYKDLQVIMGAINSTNKWKNLELKIT
jgi:predicted dehydrogenase